VLSGYQSIWLRNEAWTGKRREEGETIVSAAANVVG